MKTCILSGNFALDTIVTRNYPNGFVVGKSNKFTETIVAETVGNTCGYAACKQDNGWKLVKVTQFPMPEYTVIGEGFSSAEEAMKSIGIDDSEKYLTKGMKR